MEKEKTDFGYQQVHVGEKQQLVTNVFNSVAKNYDLMNDLMSFGIHRLWKRHAIALLQIRPHFQILDLATGTGDLACLMAKRLVGGLITISDINQTMLQHAKHRLIDQGYVDNIRIVQANAECLPFASNHFDRIIMGFGLRNVTFKEKALASIYRVLKPGGRMIILEFSQPLLAPLSKLYDAYSFSVLPKLGEWIAKDKESYQYLAESIRMHPNQEALKKLILDVGFNECDVHNLQGGIVAIHKGIKY
ncbi:MAG: bifunctional demethylmenaquinone methyltransferase/2-methoxy-6-polyprenyl-1,4-benzoquinol methylase UbiE [Proteobacteria bacterium]|nr:bifunctional demethylmenaquinone methyltransferase/2-methoxy-6-polyprenyl-1,4-benzoquinol methylase UbiE [Pseudomonadota bacterium]